MYGGYLSLGAEQDALILQRSASAGCSWLSRRPGRGKARQPQLFLANVCRQDGWRHMEVARQNPDHRFAEPLLFSQNFRDHALGEPRVPVKLDLSERAMPPGKRDKNRMAR